MKSSFLLYLALLSSVGLQAQITVTSSTLPALGDTLRYSWAYNQATFDMITPPGFDLSWDLSGLTADESLAEVYLPPSEGVHAARFPGADLMTRNAAGEERYYVVSASGLRLQGWTENTLFGEPFTMVYDFTRNGAVPGAGLNERFTPLNFFDIYSQSANILEGMRFNELPAPIRNALLAAGLTTTDSVRLRVSYSNINSVDAYGTATIPGPGTPPQPPVLRQKTTQYREGRIDGHVIPLGWLDITDITVQYFPASIQSLGVDTTGAHTFFNDVIKEEIARITLDAEGLPHDVRFKNNAPLNCFDPDLVDPTLNGDPITAGSYEASQTITATGRIASGATVQFIAGIGISLQSGFRAEAGCSFTAKIISCPTTADLLVAERQDTPPASFPPLNEDKDGFPRLLSVEGRLKIHPNPVRTSAQLKYYLATPGPVWIGVSDANGRLLQVLQNREWEAAGPHFMDWTPPDHKTGLYYVWLKTNEGVVSKKMALIR